MIRERMNRAIAKMIARKRVPRVFFLEPDHYAEFVIEPHDEVEATFSKWGVPVTATFPAFKGLPVRQSESKQAGASKLYCCVGTSVAVPRR